MKAIRVHEFGEPKVMELEDISTPSPGPDEILITLKAAGINPVETYIRAGQYAKLPPLPFTPGLDGAGIVEAIGSNVTTHAIGDRVYIAGSVTGTYAEKTICDTSKVYPLPDNISFSQGAALGVPYATAYQALHHKAHTTPGQTVLIHGASGAVGLAAIQIARSLGLTVLGTAGSQAGRDLLLSQGTKHVYDHHDPQHGEAIQNDIKGKGVNIILEMLADINLALDMELLNQSGQIIVIGNRGTIEINPRQLMMKDASVTGMLLANATTEQRQAIHQGIVQGLKEGSLNPVIAKEYSLADAAQAHHDIMNTSHAGKLVLYP